MWEDIEGRIFVNHLGHVQMELARGPHIIAIQLDPLELKQFPELYGLTLNRMMYALCSHEETYIDSKIVGHGVYRRMHQTQVCKFCQIAVAIL